MDNGTGPGRSAGTRPGSPCMFGFGGKHGPRRLRHSLFIKLLLVLLLTGCLINICVGGFFRLAFSQAHHEGLERNLSHYAETLAREVGSPPDTSAARALARTYSLRIMIQGPGDSWQSAPGLEALAERAARDKDDATGWYRGHYYTQVESGGYRYLFASDMHAGIDARLPTLAALIAGLSLLLLCAYLAIRRMLSPIKDLISAVEGVGGGELGRQVPESRRMDELGDLSRAFNAMSSGLAGLVRAREQLLLDVSHELRSPLTRIRVALEMSPDGAGKESIRDDVAEMDAMIGEILEAARLDSQHGKLSLEDVDLMALAGDIARGFAGRRPGVTLLDAMGSGSSRESSVRADRERARKVLANVIDNALKYSESSARQVEISLAPFEGVVGIKVRDYGAGIPEEVKDRLFEPFYRVDPSRSRDTGGYGLGLSLCKRIMDAHGGRIEINSQGGASGGGTEVIVFFPRG